MGFSTSAGNMQVTNTQGSLYLQADTNNAHSSSAIICTVDNSEKMRINDDGRMTLGSSTNVGTADHKLSIQKGTAGRCLGLGTTLTSASIKISFVNGNGTVGTVQTSGSGTTYNTSSDRRLKTDIQPIADATDKLMQMQPVTHKWIADPDGDAVHGFIAQDMQQVCPEAISGEDGGEEMMSMDYGRITPVLVAALQEANRKINQLEQRIVEMENN